MIDLSGVENRVWFAVSSFTPPKESDFLYGIEPFSPAKALEEMCEVPEVKWYMGLTYFKQVACLADLGRQYPKSLMFFAFTGWESDFSFLQKESHLRRILPKKKEPSR
mgnify:CR=1 FL=1